MVGLLKRSFGYPSIQIHLKYSFDYVCTGDEELHISLNEDEEV